MLTHLWEYWIIYDPAGTKGLSNLVTMFSPVKDSLHSGTPGSNTNSSDIDLFADSSPGPKLTPAKSVPIATSKVRTALILGTSQQVDLKAEKLAK